MSKTWLVVVGGFLGAGKTTLLLAAMRELKKRNLRCALILNDQGDALVDSEMASLQEVLNAEVTGGCFCCKFSEFASRLDDLRAFVPDIIFAEPVGSCTDIAATLLRPLRAYEDYQVAPFTVLVDPSRGSELLQKSADPRLTYLFIKQMQEADLICFTKSDLFPHPPDVAEYIRGCQQRQVSAVSGQGVAAWLDEVLACEFPAGGRGLDIDYEQYAQAEAALAWLNLSVDLQPTTPTTPAELLGPFFDQVGTDLTCSGITIVHMKAIMQGPTGYVKAAVCRSGDEPQIEGDLDASPTANHHLLLNLRASGDAEQVQRIVEKNLNRFDARMVNVQMNAFHPSAPVPERRVPLPGAHCLDS